ncbi:hypothetical protein IAR50_001153 [Cryptococcus sp. DSM 104548]
MAADYHRMDRLHTAFTHLRTRSQSSTDNLPQPPADEWYIPYTGNPNPSPKDDQRPQKKVSHHRKTSSLGGNLRSALCGAEMEDDDRERRDVRHHPPVAGVQRFLPLSHKGSSTSFSTPSSQGSFLQTPVPATRFPSYTSVPTGLEEPNILFSPLNRELRAKAEISGEDPPLRGQDDSNDFNDNTRRRTVSMPGRSHPILDTYQPKEESRQWLVPSARELFLLPRPHLYPEPLPHTQTRARQNSIESFSTSSSDHGVHVLEKTQARAKERNDWATLVQRRGRSLSLGGRAEPPPEAPIVGNAKARERERSRSRERGRSGSMLNLSLGGVQGRKRSASLGSLWGRHRKNSSVSDRGEGGVNDFGKESSISAIPTSFGRSSSTFKRDGMPPKSLGVSDPNLFGRYQGHSSSSNLAHSRGYTQSHPDLHSTLHSPQEPRHPATSVPLGRALHFKQPSVADRGGVVVISRNASTRWASSRANRSGTFLETDKPLPSLPTEQRLSSAPSDMPVLPRTDSLMFGMSPVLKGSGDFQAAQADWQRGQEIGVAVSPGLGDEPEDSLDPSQRPEERPEEDRSFSDGSSKARDFLAKQQKLARMRKAFVSPVQSPAGYRRPGPISPRVQSPLHASTTTKGDSSGAANDSSGLLPTPSSVSSAKIQIRQPTAEERGHNRSTSVGVIEGQVKDPQALTAERPWSGSDLEMRSKNGSRPSTAEHRTRSSGISTVQDEEDFHGLFFKTPHDAQSTPSLPSNNSLFPPLPPPPSMSSRGSRLSFGVDTISQGISQGLAHSTSDSQLRRTSVGSDGTMLEINTPDTMLEEVLSQGLDVGPRPVTPPRRKLLAPVTIERPIGEGERHDDSFDNSFDRSPDCDSPSRPESGTIPPQNPTVMPSPVTFSLAPKQPMVSQSHHPFAHPHNYPSTQSLHTPLQLGRPRSKGDGIPVSPAMSWHRDSAAVSFVDDFPSPPGRYPAGEEREERIYSPAVKRRMDFGANQ